MASAALAVQAPSVSDFGIISVALAPSTSTAAIAADVSLAGGFGTSVSSRTQAMTLGSAANYLLVFVIGDTASDLITGVTYNGVSLTQLKSFYPGASVGWLYLYGLASPTTGGSHNIVVSASGSCSQLGLEAQSYANCAASQPNTVTTNASRSATIGWSIITPSVAGCWGVSCVRYTASAVPTFQSASGCGTTASLRVSQSASDLGSIVDTNGTIPFLTPVALTPNAAQWRLQRMDISRRKERKEA